MAVIGKIRQHSVILLIVVAIALLAFILGDFVRPSGNVYGDFAQVGNTEISYFTFSNQYEHYRMMSQERNGEKLSPADDFQLGLEIFNSMLDSILLSKQLKPLGIDVSPEEIRDLMAGENPHYYARMFFSDPNTGMYNSQQAQSFIDNMDLYEPEVVNAYLERERIVENEAIRNKYINLVSKSFYMPKAFARKMQEEQDLQADIRLVQVSYSNDLVSDDKIQISEKETQQWYEDNKYRFPQDEELREIEYVIFDIEPSMDDLKNIENDFREKYQEFVESENPKLYVNLMVDSHYDSTFFKKDELPPSIDTLLFDAPVGTFVEPFMDGDYWVFAKKLSEKMRPDSINVNFMFIAHEGVQDAPRTKEASKLIVDSAFFALISGMRFEDVSRMFSDVKPEQQQDSGRIWLQDIVGGDRFFFDTLYNLFPGTVFQYEVPNGTYIFRINERTQLYKKIQVAIGQREIDASSETIDNVESAANTFVNGTETYEQFNEQVTNMHLNKRTFDRLQALSYTIPGVEKGAREVVRWAYDKDTKKGAVSGVFNLEGKFVVATLKDVYPKGYMSLEQVRSFVEMMVRREKKAEKLTELLTASIAKTKDLGQIAREYKSTVDTLTIPFSARNFGHYGPEIKVIGKLFAHTKGNLDVYEGDMGVYVISISDIKNTASALEMDADKNEMINMISQQQVMRYQQQAQNAILPALKKMYKIVDNRYKIY